MSLSHSAEKQDASPTPAEGEQARSPFWTGDLALALAGALVSLAISALLGFPRLAAPGEDNDSLLRLVQVRDLLAGQGWFDLHQYRMGAEGGFVMHWSRLVDAPIAGLILLLRPLLGNAGAEFATAMIWPVVLMALSLFALLRAARAFGGEEARLPVLLLAATAFHFLGIFAPGTFDHHNVQLALVLAVTALLVVRRSFAAGLAAGVAAAASMTVGMETIPYVAAAGLSVALLFWLRGAAEIPATSGFGLGFAGGAALSLALTVPPQAWLATTCDAVLGAQAGSAVIAGLGIAATAALTGTRSAPTRLAALAALAVISAVFVLVFYPQCLAHPYAAAEPRLRDYWLNWVSEAQPLHRIIFNRPAEAATYYITPTIALGIALLRLARARNGMALTVTLMLVAAIAVSVWQVRGAIFSLALATIPLSAWVGAMRSRAAAGAPAGATLGMVAAWLVSFNVAWGTLGHLVFEAGKGAASGGERANACETAGEFARLAELPPGRVLAVSNNGAMILAFTPHSVLAGPYHRNIEGNLAMLDAMAGTPEEALDIVRRHDVAYVAVCPGNPETRILAREAPDGLLARIVQERPVAWLAPVAGSDGEALRIFRTAP